jgi:hypothetical protein
MRDHPAIKNYLYYFKEAKKPVVWHLGYSKAEARKVAEAIYSGSPEWMENDATVIGVAPEARINPKKLTVDVIMIDTSVAPLDTLDKFLIKAKVFLVKTDDEAALKTKFKETGLTLVDESNDLVWVRS